MAANFGDVSIRAKMAAPIDARLKAGVTASTAVDVSDSRAFDEAAARSETNRPLRVDAATARAPADPLPAGLPPAKKKKRRRREL